MVVRVVAANWYVVVAVREWLMPLPLSCDRLQIVWMIIGWLKIFHEIVSTTLSYCNYNCYQKSNLVLRVIITRMHNLIPKPTLKLKLTFPVRHAPPLIIIISTINCTITILWVTIVYFLEKCVDVSLAGSKKRKKREKRRPKPQGWHWQRESYPIFIR